MLSGHVPQSLNMGLRSISDSAINRDTKRYFGSIHFEHTPLMVAVQ
jgi:hypothetical protein